MSVVRPTLLLAFGHLGDRVLRRLARDEGGRHEARLRALFVGDVEEARRQAQRELDQILEFGSHHREALRLDIAILLDLRESAATRDLERLLRILRELLVSQYGGIFMNRGQLSEERLAMFVVSPVPGLSPHPELTRLMGGLRALEGMVSRESIPLNRAFLLPVQHMRGRLSDVQVEISIYTFISAVWLSGVRDGVALAQRLTRSSSGRLFSTFSTAAAGVSVEQVLEACAWRTADMALEVLSENCRTQSVRGDDIRDTLGELFDTEWRRQPAHRERGAEGGRGAPEVPELHWKWSRAQVAEAFEWAARRGAAPAPTNDWTTWDRWEERGLDEQRQRLEALVLKETAPELGLRRLSVAEAALQHYEGVVSKERDEALSRLGQPERVEDPRPTGDPRNLAIPWLQRGELLVYLLGSSLLCTVATWSVWIYLLSEPASSKNTRASVWGFESWPEVSIGLSVGVVLALAMTAWLRSRSARLVQERAQEYFGRDRWHQDSGSASSKQVRQARLLSGLTTLVRSNLAHLKGARLAIDDARGRARATLKRLNEAHVEDNRTMVHHELVEPKDVEALWKTTRGTNDPDRLAEQVLLGAWPEKGLGSGLPFAEEEAWFAICRAQHRRLVEENVFTWPVVAEKTSEKATTFLRVALRLLDLGPRPVDRDGMPLAGTEAPEMLLIHPPEARVFVQALRDGEGAAFGLEAVMGQETASRVVALMTQVPFSSDELRAAVDGAP